MPRKRPLDQWIDQVVTAFPKLTRPQAVVLALYSFGVILAHRCGHLLCAMGKREPLPVAFVRVARIGHGIKARHPRHLPLEAKEAAKPEVRCVFVRAAGLGKALERHGVRRRISRPPKVPLQLVGEAFELCAQLDQQRLARCRVAPR